jgi:hypothetical protein
VRGCAALRLALLFGFDSRKVRGDGETGRNRHADKRRCGNYQHALLAAVLLTLLERVEADTEHARDQFQPGVDLAVALVARIGGDRFGADVGEFSIVTDFVAQRRWETFLVFLAKLVGRPRFAADDQTEDSFRAPQALERQYLLVNPARFGRGRRTDDYLGCRPAK